MSAVATAGEDDFQVAKPKKQQSKSVRVYIGNLPENVEGLESLLLQILKDKTGLASISESDISVTNRNTISCYAFVSCPSNNDADTVIASLHRQDFHSKKLTVQRERKSKRDIIISNSHNKFTNKPVRAKKPFKKGSHQPPPSTFGKKMWSKAPASTATAQEKKVSTTPSQVPAVVPPQPATSNAPRAPANNSASDFMSQVIANEMQSACATGDKDVALNTAMASLAAVSMMAPIMNDDDAAQSKNTTTQENTEDKEVTTLNDFQSRCQKPMSELLGGYGEEDREWRSFQPKAIGLVESDAPKEDAEVLTLGDFKSRCQKPLSDLLTGYGEEDPEWQAFQPTAITNNAAIALNSNTEPNADTDAQETEAVPENSAESTENRLGRQGKAPIHVEFVSFGNAHGAPAAIRNGWSHAQPLPSFECRDLPTVPGHLMWRNGTSGFVQRTLMTEPDIRDMANSVGEKAFVVLQEAIDEGGHGYVSPLEMKVYVGSELGKHRSVVVCENAAKRLRALLRKNVDNCITSPTSVGTAHRDIERAKRKDRKSVV